MPSNPPSSEAVAIEGLVVDYRGDRSSLRVLGGVDLELAHGEIVAVIGPSGCGKTTLLHAIMGLVRPSSGAIRLGLASVGLVFQEPHLFPWRDVLGNAAYGLECRGVAPREARERARVLLQRMKLGDHLGDRPHQLSEGMKQRVNLARALLVEPELLLMDEPYSALDIVTRRALQEELLKSWQERKFTLLLSSHSLEEVVLLADRVAALSEKPARITALVNVDLPRPRGVGPEGNARLFSRVLELTELLAPARAT